MSNNGSGMRAGGSIGQHHWRPVDRPEPAYNCGLPKRPTNPWTGPHNRCDHETAPTPGLHPCRGDHACPFRLPAGRDLCPEHAREARMTVHEVRAEVATAIGMSTSDIGRITGGSVAA